MDQKPDVILQSIDDTRSALTEKLGRLEDQVWGTVETAKSTVTDTISSIKSSVEGTVQNVKQSVSVPYQVEHRPWLMVGASVAAGFLLSRAAQRRSNYSSYRSGSYSSFGKTEMGFNPPVSQIRRELEEGQSRGEFLSQPPQESRAHRVMDFLRDNFGDEIKMVKGVLVSTALDRLGSQIKNSYPAVGEAVDSVVDRVQDKLGYKPSKATA